MSVAGLPWVGACGNSTCVEIAPHPDGGFLIRAASTLPGEEVHATRMELRALLMNARNGVFDHLVEDHT